MSSIWIYKNCDLPSFVNFLGIEHNYKKHFLLNSTPFPGQFSLWRESFLFYTSLYILVRSFFLSVVGFPPFTEIYYIISQWSCSALGSLRKMPDSNPGPLPRSLVRYINEPSHIQKPPCGIYSIQICTIYKCQWFYSIYYRDLLFPLAMKNTLKFS